MKQTEARAIFSPLTNDQRHLIIGNILFEFDVNNSSNSSYINSSQSSLSSTSSNSCNLGQEASNPTEEEYYASLMKLKQKIQPIYCIQSNNKSSQIEATFLQERKSSDFNYIETKEFNQEILNRKPSFGSVLQRYYALRNSLSSFNQLDQQSDSGMTSSNNTTIQEIKDNIFYQFCHQELAKFNDLNGKQQFFSYTVVQCLDDEYSLSIYKMGYSESLISILGSSRNNFQQLLMRSGTYLPFHQDIRLHQNISLLESFLLCHEKSHENQNFHTYSESCQIETFERLFFNCMINKYVIPCTYRGQQLGFIVLDLYTIPTSVVKDLLQRRRQLNCFPLTSTVPQEYKQKSELFLQKIKSFSP